MKHKMTTKTQPNINPHPFRQGMGFEMFCPVFKIPTSDRTLSNFRNKKKILNNTPTQNKKRERVLNQLVFFTRIYVLLDILAFLLTYIMFNKNHKW